MKLLTLALIGAVASPAIAGGPVTVIEDRYDTEIAGDSAKVNPLVIVGIAVAACLILCGRDKDAPVAPPPPTCNSDC